MKKKFKPQRKPVSYRISADGSKLIINNKVVRTGSKASIKSLREYMVRHNLTKVPLGM